MSDLITRALTGLFFISLVVGGIWWSDFASFGVFLLFLVLGMIEFTKLFSKYPSVELCKTSFIASGLLLFVLLSAVSIGMIQSYFYVLIFPLLFLVFLPELWRKKTHPILNLSVLVFGIIYLVLPFYLFVELAVLSAKNSQVLIGMFILVWSNDSFAYLSGRIFGKTKLFERISPKKTWEGTLGGILLTAVSGFLISTYLDSQYDLAFWLIASFLVALCSIFGDLLESLFKRSLDIKDTGNILPGHGGVLDRFDAAILSAPIFYAWLVIYPYI
jgi:phosphatidate cytidylyltransferase